MIKPKRWRGADSQPHTLGEPSPSLSPLAREQWEEVRGNEASLRRYTRAWATAEHENEVFTEATRGLHTKLENGPVAGSVLAYMKTICKNEAGKHCKKIAKQRERVHPVGDDTWLLGTDDSVLDEDPMVLKEIRASLKEKLPLLREVLSDQQYRVFVLTEADGMNCFEISKALGGEVSPGAIRQSLKAARDKLKRPVIRARLGVSPLAE
ncbi:sigma-70 family RNA polymerase sigma factor [Streptomyces niveus]|uniref:Sigma-70 family RNA polymerase sigma factor n=1 Tax=Streptomyces niveus TaxID=193462 RepID=A0ABZ2A3I6_STRNV|nr:sigma-70 family RNA polymerase sigma factor [Streptomyces niveus]